MIFKALSLILIVVLATLCGCRCGVDREAIEEVKNYPLVEGAGQIIYANDFDNGYDSKMKFGSGYTIKASEGRNGTSALCYERTDAKEYRYSEVVLPTLDSAKTYKLELYVRGENIKNHGEDKNIGSACVEYYKDSKWQSGAYIILKSLESDWQHLTYNITAKEGCEARLRLYLRRGYTGKIWFDDVSVTTAGSADAIVLNTPKMLTVKGDCSEFSFTTAPHMSPELELLLELDNEGKTQEFLLKGVDNKYSIKIDDLAVGCAKVKVTAVDRATKQSLYMESFNLKVIEDERAPENSCIIDEYGRAIVDGKPTMIIGVYGNAKESDLKIIADSGVNALMTYASMNINGGKASGDRIADIKAGLDLYSKYGIKAIFSLKDQYEHKKNGLSSLNEAKDKSAVAVEVVKAIKSHPALLCWYINDEEARQMVPEVVKLREKVSAEDPWHPTWSLTYRNGDFPYYGISGDIMGVDQYTIDAKKPSQSLAAVVESMERASSSGQAVWMVPQTFNWEVYRTKDPKVFAQGRFPTQGEINANTLIGVIYGAKGFVFYSYFDIKDRAELLSPGSFAEDWPKVEATIRLLKDLEPYIMSSKPITFLPVKQDGKGEVKAALLTSEQGEQAVIIVAVDDQASGTVTLPSSDLIEYAPGAINAKVMKL